MTAQPRPRPSRLALRRLLAAATVVAVAGGLLAQGGTTPVDDRVTPTGATATSAVPTQFKVANFNVLGHSHTVPGGNRPGWASSSTRMLWTTQLMAKYDVDLIGFQEFEPAQYDRFKALMGSSWDVWPGRAIRDSSASSVAWRTNEWTAITRSTYQSPYFYGKMRTRPLVQLRNNRTGQLVWLMNTHNPADTRGDAQKWRDAAERIQAALVNRLRAARPDIPVIFTGDMNDRERFYCPVTYLSELESASGGYHVDVPGGACEPRRPMRVDWIMGTSDIRFSGYTDVQDDFVRKTSDHSFLFATATVPPQPARLAGVRRVVVVDVQGLRSGMVSATRTPHLARLVAQGAATLNARTDDSSRAALPNTISILTGRPVPRSSGGHGVTSDAYRGPSVHAAAGQYVSSVYDMAHNLGLRTAFFSGDPRSALVPRTWASNNAGLDGYGVNNGRGKISIRTIGTDAEAITAARTDLAERPAGLTVVQLSGPLAWGTKYGWQSRRYHNAVATADQRLGKVLATIQAGSRTAGSTLVIATSSSAGTPTNYGYRIPLAVWGPSVEHADLYALNPGYRNPGTARLPASGTPITTGVIGNLVTSALTLPTIPRSRLNTRQNFDVFGH